MYRVMTPLAVPSGGALQLKDTLAMPFTTECLKPVGEPPGAVEEWEEGERDGSGRIYGGRGGK